MTLTTYPLVHPLAGDLFQNSFSVSMLVSTGNRETLLTTCVLMLELIVYRKHMAKLAHR